VTTSEAEAVFPFPPSVEVTAVVVLSFVPDVAPVTTKLNVQLLFVVREPPVRAIVLGAVVVSDPPHAVVGPLVSTVKPAGKVSVKLMPLNELLIFGFVMVKVSVDGFVVKMDAGEKDLASAGGAITVSEAVA